MLPTSRCWTHYFWWKVSKFLIPKLKIGGNLEMFIFFLKMKEWTVQYFIRRYKYVNEDGPVLNSRESSIRWQSGNCLINETGWKDRTSQVHTAITF